MAAIVCPDCGNQVSGKAAACPTCGHPMRRPGVVTTQQTAKRYKAAQLVGVLLCAAGTVSCVDRDVITMSALWTGGLGIYAAARFAAWWSHG